MEGLAQQLLATKSPRCTKKRPQPCISLNKPNNGMLNEEQAQRQATLATLHGTHKQQADVHTAPSAKAASAHLAALAAHSALRTQVSCTNCAPSRVGQKAHTSVCTPAPCACLPCSQANSRPSTPPSQHMQVHGITHMHPTVCTACLQDRLQPMPHPASSPPSFPSPGTARRDHRGGTQTQASGSCQCGCRHRELVQVRLAAPLPRLTLIKCAVQERSTNQQVKHANCLMGHRALMRQQPCDMIIATTAAAVAATATTIPHPKHTKRM